MNKKYFLRDEEIHSVDDDFFRHQDVANNITRILENNKPPYNIAVIGKWGLGKSSLINLVTDRLSNNQNYVKVDINAWKYEKEVLGKVFLRQVLQRLDEKEGVQTQQEKSKKWFEKFLDSLRQKDTKPLGKLIWEPFKKGGGFLLLYAGVMFVLYAGYKCLALWNLGESLPDFPHLIATIITGYCRNIAVLLFAPMLLAFSARITEDIRKRAIEKVEVKLPEVSVEDYEIELQRKIAATVKDNKNFKIVIILDDLDRLSYPKMVEALSAIKMFINFPNCIFIVPFDDSIIKSAIASVKNKDSKQGGDTIEGDLLLDKLFQYKLFLAPLLKYDIKKYATDLCIANMQDFIKEYCEEKIFVKALRNILIHSYVETPRQVKKVVNVFVANMMTARERQRVGKVSKEYVAGEAGIFTIAKLSVLQADFNEFYDLLFVIPEAIDIVLETQRKIKNSENIDNFPRELKNYFGMKDDIICFSKEYQPLLNFLNKTAKYTIDNIIPYLYVAMDDVSVLTGSAKQQEFIKAATSGNVIDAARLLKETPQLIEAVILYFQQEDDVDDLINLMKSTFYDMKDINEGDRIRVASAIAERADEIANNWSELDEVGLNFQELLDCYQICENQSEYRKILNQSLITDNVDYSLEKIEAFARYINELDQETIHLFNNSINGILEHDYIRMDEFVDVKVEYMLYDEVWIEQYYKYLIRHIEETKKDSKPVIGELCDTFEKVVEIKGINYCFAELKPLFNLLQMTSIFKDFLQREDAYNIGTDVLEDLICQQIGIYNNVNNPIDTSELSELINSINCEFSGETAAILDKYFASVVGKDDVGKLIRNFSLNNDISLIDNSIKETIKWIFTAPFQQKDDCLDNIMAAVDARRKREILDKIKTACAISSTKTYGHLHKFVIKYAKHAWNEIHPYLVSLAGTISNTLVNDSYVQFVSNCFVDVSGKLTEQEIETYVDALISKIKANRCEDSCISAVCAVSKYISDEKFLEIEPTIYSKVNESNCETIYNAFKQHLNQFTGENQNYGHLIHVCFLVIENTDLHNEAIELLNKKFNYIRRVLKLVELIENVDGIEKEKAYKVIRKFLVRKDIATATNDILDILVEFGEDIVDAILSESRADMSMKMAEQITQNVNIVSSETLLHYITWIVGQNDVTFNENINNMIQLAIDVCDTEDQYKRIVEIMENMKREQYKGCSKMYTTPIVNLLRKTTSVEVKKRLLEVAKGLRQHNAVMKQLPAVLHDELKDY